MTTRKHFERVALYIKTELAGGGGPFAEQIAEGAYLAAVYLFQGDNPRFDVERFRLACGLRVGPGPAFPCGAVHASTGRRGTIFTYVCQELRGHSGCHRNKDRSVEWSGSGQ